MNVGEAKLREYLKGLSGSFYTSLFRAMFKADASNLERLRLGFPEEVQAVIDWRTIRGYAEKLEDGDV